MIKAVQIISVEKLDEKLKKGLKIISACSIPSDSSKMLIVFDKE